MSKKNYLLLIIAFALIFTTACSKNDNVNEKKPEETTEQTNTGETNASEDKETKEETKGELVYRTTGMQLSTLNPHISSTSAEGEALELISANLLTLTYSKEKDTFDFTPNLAEALPEMSNEGKTWTWKIRKDLKWSDGTPINAHDFEYSWKMLLDPKLKNITAPEAFFTGDVSVVNAKKYWIGNKEDNIKYEAQKKEEKELSELMAEIDKMEDGEEKTKKEEEYQNRMGALQANYIELSDEDVAAGGVSWDEVGIKCIDDYTIEMNLEYQISPVNYWTKFASGGATSLVKKDLYENGMNEDKTGTNYGSAIDKMDFSGPYVLSKWENGSLREYKKNEYSPLKDIFTPNVITERVVSDSNTAQQLFENNEIDVLNLGGAALEKYGEDPRVVYTKSDAVVQMFMNMTTTDPEKAFLTDINFRKAMYWGMDRQTIAKDIIKTAVPQPCVVANTRAIDPMKGTTYRDTEQGKANYPENDGYDPAMAKEFFDKAYEKFGKKIKVELMYYDTSEQLKNVAEYLKEEYENMFGKDKIEVSLRAVPPNNVFQKLMQADYDMGFGAWSGGAFNPWQGMDVYTSYFGAKCDQFKSDEFDKLFERTNKGDLIFKEKEKIDALAEMERMLLDNMPFVPMYQSENARIYSDRVHLLPKEWKIGVGFAPLQAELDPLK